MSPLYHEIERLRTQVKEKEVKLIEAQSWGDSWVAIAREREAQVREGASALARQQYDDLLLLCERDEKISRLENAVEEKDEMIIAERAVSQCLREDFNKARKQIVACAFNITALIQLRTAENKQQAEEVAQWKLVLVTHVREIEKLKRLCEELAGPDAQKEIE